MAAAHRHEPWLVEASEFPADESAAEALRFALRYAVLAPSSHNSQPWLFHIAGHAVGIYADRSRGLPVVDPDDRELVMSCAAALFNLRVALSHFDLRHYVTVLPDGVGSDLLARIDLTGVGPALDHRLDGLFAAIPNRHTCRRAFDETPVDGRVELELHEAAVAEAALLIDVPAAVRHKVTSLVTEADFVQMSDPAFRRELAHWMRPNHSMRADGMPGYALGLSELQSVVGPLIVRTFDVGSSQAAKDDELSRGSALLAVLTTPSDDVADWLAAGQAMQRVLLTATAAGLRSSFLNQPVEISSMRLQMARELALPGEPQVLLRFGYSPDSPATPRRAVADMLLSEPPIQSR